MKNENVGINVIDNSILSDGLGKVVVDMCKLCICFRANCSAVTSNVIQK